MSSSRERSSVLTAGPSIQNMNMTGLSHWVICSMNLRMRSAELFGSSDETVWSSHRTWSKVRKRFMEAER